MEHLASIGFLLAGLALLYIGAEGLLGGSISLALRSGLSPLIIGLTVVAFGTSAPELFVSTRATLADQGGIAIGNIVGSNCFNIAIILGVCALISPIQVSSRLIRQDIPVLLAATLLFVIMLLDRYVGRVEGAILLTSLFAYLGLTVWLALHHREDPVATEYGDEIKAPSKSLLRDLAWIVGGILLLMFGADLMVQGAVQLARAMGISEVVIGLTLIAGGTGLPELATSLVAARKKQADIAVGNVVGSNLFNLLCITGVTATVRPITAVGLSNLDLIVMSALTFLMVPLMISGKTISRREGFLLFALYSVYLFVLFRVG
ncbi:MAG: calcium/sodium antiporter [Kiritimatiellae bacterium]|nr:calcium/sodium antiporter [Kiritimatiellia bacterium]